MPHSFQLFIITILSKSFYRDSVFVFKSNILEKAFICFSVVGFFHCKTTAGHFKTRTMDQALSLSLYFLEAQSSCSFLVFQSLSSTICIFS